ncbi:MAG: hypothetical protein AVDCRST_MAG69-2688 [uncultured Solirubrobacteraceae bacterium]|uniref:Uncharacterized protein n=1 Tax=uncultured Solirubrobacteraceae bacterium TaxID=1162706 RepID=A0A6J4T5M5_9ACTN|nr:MAG: hypothetical protein AVDCRST_MAG69-2688 [uncultured Solirubrobacteraceae bacterium]
MLGADAGPAPDDLHALWSRPAKTIKAEGRLVCGGDHGFCLPGKACR